MAFGEFEIIEKYFRDFSKGDKYLVTGIGDDAAQLQLPDDCDLVVTSVTLVESVHFEAEEDPAITGHKLLSKAINQLDLKGASPKWMTLSLQLSEINESWLQQMLTGIKRVAEPLSIQLLGGDTTKGNTTLTLHLHGLISRNKPIVNTPELAR